MHTISLPQLKDVSGVVLYEGKSLIDGKDIVAIATGFDRTRNRKLGKKSIQVWIMVADLDPATALNSGADKSICGTCKHRHFRSCYVNLAHGPAQIYKAWTLGKYPKLPSYEVFRDKFVRFGAYGDPAAVPLEIWQNIAEVCDVWTGYTHRWKVCDKGLQEFCMASCDTLAEAEEAIRRGWRPFYVRQESDPVPHGFFVCPASKEAGSRMSCSRCKMCKGGHNKGRKGFPTIIAHGPSWKKVYFSRGMEAYSRKQSYVRIGWKNSNVQAPEADSELVEV